MGAASRRRTRGRHLELSPAARLAWLEVLAFLPEPTEVRVDPDVYAEGHRHLAWLCGRTLTPTSDDYTDAVQKWVQRVVRELMRAHLFKVERRPAQLRVGSPMVAYRVQR